MAKKLLMIVGDYVEDYEAMVPFQSLTAIGYSVDTVCPDKSQGDFVLTAVHDFEGAQTYSEKPGHRFILNKSFDSIVLTDYDGLIVPGGRAPEYLRLDARVLDAIRHFFEAEKPVACICHGLQLLTTAGVLSGYTCTGYATCAPEAEAVGATYKDVGLEGAITDRNLVTGFAWTSHPEWLAQFVRLLGTTITHS